MPQPTAVPLTAAITGLVQSSAAIAAGVGRATRGAASAGRASPVIISFTSSPEQKDGSAPVTITPTHLVVGGWRQRNAGLDLGIGTWGSARLRRSGRFQRDGADMIPHDIERVLELAG